MVYYYLYPMLSPLLPRRLVVIILATAFWASAPCQALWLKPSQILHWITAATLQKGFCCYFHLAAEKTGPGNLTDLPEIIQLRKTRIRTQGCLAGSPMPFTLTPNYGKNPPGAKKRAPIPTPKMKRTLYHISYRSLKLQMKGLSPFPSGYWTVSQMCTLPSILGLLDFQYPLLDVYCDYKSLPPLGCSNSSWTWGWGRSAKVPHYVPFFKKKP